MAGDARRSSVRTPRRLALSGYKNGTAGVWTADGHKRGLLRGHRDRVWSVAFSPGGDPAVQLLEVADRRKLRPARVDLDLLQKKYGLRLVGVDLVEVEPR